MASLTRPESWPLPLGLWIALFAVLMTGKYFPGLENETLYSGNVFQILNPEAFTGDPFRDPNVPLWQRPTQLSLFYGLVWLGGDIWLDDRFVAVFFALITAASLMGIDRIAQAFGITGRLERLIILLFFLKDHQILTAKVLVAHHQDVNPSALAIPVLIWLFYAVIARRGLIWTVLGCALITLISVRMALFASVAALGAEMLLGTRREKWVAGVLLAGGLGLFFAGLLYFTPADDTLRLALWEKFRHIENNDADPFASDGIGHMWLRYTAAASVVLMGWFLTPASESCRALRAVIAIAVAVFVIGGIYINFAPDAIKLPLLISFVPARVTSWLQNLCYVGALAGLLSSLGTARSGRVIAGILAALAFLYLAGPGNIDRWAILLTGGAAVGFLINGRGLLRRSDAAAGVGRPVLSVTLTALLIVTAAAYGLAFKQNAGAWADAAEHGIYGANPSAKWRDVGTYLKKNTTTGTVVLPYHCRRPGNCQELLAKRALATRSGLALAAPEVAGGGFSDLEVWEMIERQESLTVAAGAALAEGGNARAAHLIADLPTVPDILLIPSSLSPTESYNVGEYRESARVDHWIILRKGPRS